MYTAYKYSRWAERILALQGEDGLWGNFHTLSQPDPKRPLTTEQALRRLYRLGYTLEDPPIQRAVAYMQDCLAGRRTMPDRREKLHNWELFTKLMLSTWVRIFTAEDANANQVAQQWAEVIGSSFMEGQYDQGRYTAAYTCVFGIPPRGGRLVDFVSFYQVSLLSGERFWDTQTEQAYFRHLLTHPDGIYYLSTGCLSNLPGRSDSIAASRYLGGIELLAGYTRCLDRLQFVRRWLLDSRGEDGQWDMGPKVRDGVYFPLSDSWRRADDRKRDCSYRIEKLLQKLTPL